MPSGYEMLRKVLASVLKGDWTARKIMPPRIAQKAVKGRRKSPRPLIVQIVVALSADLANISSMLQVGPVTGATLSVPCAAAHQFPYDLSDYDRFAKALGYV